MSAHSEKDFVNPIIQIVNLYNNGCMMDEIIKEIPKFIELNNEDMLPNPSRHGEEKYKQVVRNLVSHKNKALLDNVRIECKENSKKRIFYPKDINTAISQTQNDTCDIFEENVVENFSFFEAVYDEYDLLLQRQVNAPNFNGKIQRASGLAEKVKRLCDYECQYTQLINGEKDTFLDKNNNPYVEAHHLIPLNEWKDFYPKSLDRPSNLVVLSDRWHKVLHNANREQVKPVLTALYYARINDLNKDGIWISLEDLLKYYK